MINILTELRCDGPKHAKKSKRIVVDPGKSVSVEDIEYQDPTENRTSGSSKQPSKKKPSSSKTSRKRKVRFFDSERDDESGDDGLTSE